MKIVVAVLVAITVLAPLMYVYATQNAQIGFGFQANPRVAPMYNFWFHRYMTPSGSSDCQWIGARGLIVFASLQQSVTCFHQANPKIIVVSYLDRGVYTTDPLAQALWSTEAAWLHWQNGTRAHFYWNNNPLYLPDPNSTAVRSWEASNLLAGWKSIGVDGIYLDDGFSPCQFNSVWDICTKDGTPLAEYTYLGWVRAWSSWASWVKLQMGKPFHIYPGSVDWYTTLNSTILSAWLNGMDGTLLESYPRPFTWADQIAGYYQMQSQYYRDNPTSLIEFFTYSNIIPSLYWLAAYYLLAKNFTTNNLYLSVPLNYPVPQGVCCEGWNPAVWDNLNLGSPQGASAIIDAFGDGTATLYIRSFQKGVVVAMQHRLATDTRTLTVNLPGAYVNVTNLSGAPVSTITIGVNNAFIGAVPGSQTVAPYNVPIFSPLLIATLVLTLSAVTLRQRLAKSLHN